jgi:hypothetical protein
VYAIAESLGEQTVQVGWRTLKVTLQALMALIKHVLENQDKLQHSQLRLSKLNLQELKSGRVEFSSADMKNFRQELNKHAVDFSIVKGSAQGHYTVFFKGQDIDRVYAGLRKCMQNVDKTHKRPMREVMRDAEKAAMNRASKSERPLEKEKFSSRGHDAR